MQRAISLWLVLIALAGVGAWVTIALVNKYMYGPETDVRAYFENLREGDGGRALGLLNAEVPDADAALLDGEPLKRAASGIRDLEVSTVSQDAEHAVVRADYTLDGQPQSTEYRLHAADTQWGFFTVWDFDPTDLPTVEVSLPGASAVDVNGRSAALPRSTGTFAAFPPGRYDASYDSRLVTTQPAHVLLTEPGQHERLGLTPTASDALRQEVSRQIDQDLGQCTAQRSLYPAGCPFSYDFPGRIQDDDVQWKVTEPPRPEITIGVDGGRDWALAPAQGTAEVTFTSVDLFDGRTSTETHQVPFTYRAGIQVDDAGTVTVSR